ncbi:MAG: penicillin-binding protein activator [Gammaproteobacteria bacterium]|nr:penicillin-binding protein activator [Gammaproteobacteria bacterium]
MKAFTQNSVHRMLVAGILFISITCSSPPPVVNAPPQIESTTESIDELLRQANIASGSDSVSLRLKAIEELINSGYLDRAELEIGSIQNPNRLRATLQIQLALIRAQIAIKQNQFDSALRWLSGNLAESANGDTSAGRQLILLRGQLYQSINRNEDAIIDFTSITESWPTNAETSLFEDIWLALTSLRDEELDKLAEEANSYEMRGWIELARIYQVDQFSIRSQLDSIVQWRRIWASHSAAARLPAPLIELQMTWENRPKHIALILPLQESTGNAIQEGFLSAYYQSLSVSRDVPQISVFDSTGLTDIHDTFDQAVASGADLIIGPLNKKLVNQISERIEIPVPTLALNYTDEDRLAENLFQFGLAPEDEISQVINLAWEAGYRNAAVIMPDNVDYQRLETFFSETWTDQGGQVVSSARFIDDSDYTEVIKRLMAIDSSEARAEKLLDLLPRLNMEFTPRRRSDIDFIFLVANPRQGRQLKPTLAFYFAGDIPVFSMPSVYDGQENQTGNRDLDGIIFTDAPWVLNPTHQLRDEVNTNLRQAQGPLQRLRAMGIDSFHLYPRLKQFSNNSISSVRGTTGLLTMSENRRIHRRLTTARFEDGIAVPFRLPNSASSN